MQTKTGVLLVNLGTPEAPTAQAVKRYLAEFLSDPRVVDVARALWLPLLHGVILPLRSGRVSKLYQAIWTPEGSPLLVYSRRQQAGLQARFPQMPVELAMSYGEPSLPQAFQRLHDAGVGRILVLPLYPQYSCSTTAAVFDGVAACFAGRRDVPALNFNRDYATHPAYIDALSRSIRLSFERHGEPDRLLFSYHGIPQRYADGGDDYPLRCRLTTQAVAAALGLDNDRYMMTYQSRFGREPWLTPYTDETIATLPGQGVKHLQVICPGFASDCLETLEEIEVQNREIFLKAGGGRFEYVPALNDDDAHISMLAQLVREMLPAQ